jgi:hypothetical protein
MFREDYLMPLQQRQQLQSLNKQGMPRLPELLCVVEEQ